MTNQLATAQDSIMEQVLLAGDLSKLTADQRSIYYMQVCKSIGLNPLTRPFEYIILNGKLTLYARKDATDQVRANRNVSIIRLERERIEDVYTVTAYAQTPDGRQDSSIGAVSIGGLKGDQLANAMMKAETKAKRRVTLSICGLGILDETELETVSSRTEWREADTQPAQPPAPIPPAEQEKPAEPVMTLEQAQDMIGSDKKRYGDRETKDLLWVANNEKSPPEKRLAAKMIIDARNAQAKAEDPRPF